MIIKLNGQLIHKGVSYVIVEVSGIGYQVFLSSDSLASLSVNEQADLWIYEHVREDIHDLYGFCSERERKLFLELLDVSGVGPKMALNILSLGNSDEISRRIDAGDADWLSRVPGVGKKTAQKIILELKGKLVQIGDSDPISSEVVSALMNLGYAREQAVEASVQSGEGSVEERLRMALRALAK